MIDPWSNNIKFSYDGLGRLHTVQVNDGEIAAYAYDVLGRLSTVTVGARVFTYTYTGANTVPDHLTRPNGSVTYYTYDNLYRLMSIANQTSMGATINGNAYIYNKASMRTQETVTNGNPGFTTNAATYSYNNVNQLTHAGCSYDADGNMTQWTINGIQYTATYDAENRLKTVDYNDGTAHHAEFTYNADNFIAKQVIDGVETRFVRNGYLCLQERDGNNIVTRSYVWDSISPGGIGGLLELTQGGAQYDYLYDGKGNVSALIDANQNVVASYTYDPFGVLLSQNLYNGFTGQPYQFSTKYYYTGLDLNYFGYRFDNSMIGRWITRDPKGEAGGINLYQEMANSAINNVDAFGQDIWLEGPSPGEPEGHLSINVGDPNGSYKSYSFGVNGQGFLEGEVYEDVNKGGNFYPGYYLNTAIEQDKAAQRYLDSLLGNEGQYSPWNTCRNFSIDEFNMLKKAGYGKPGNPPARKSNPNNPSYNVPWPLSSTVTNSN